MWPILRALYDPAPPVARQPCWRHALLAPRLFDLVSCLWQQKEAWRMQVTDSLPHEAYAYNVGVTKSKPWVRTRRAERLYHLLTLPPAVPAQERLLIIGPRTVQELYLAWLYGFPWSQMRAIDLYSLHPKIQVMDMERMTFPNESFDALALSNTLAYATDLRACLQGLCRVVRRGGRMAFETVYAPQDQRWTTHAIPDQQVREWLEECGLTVRARWPEQKVNQQGYRQWTTVYLVQREAA